MYVEGCGYVFLDKWVTVGHVQPHVCSCVHVSCRSEKKDRDVCTCLCVTSRVRDMYGGGVCVRVRVCENARLTSADPFSTSEVGTRINFSP